MQYLPLGGSDFKRLWRTFWRTIFTSPLPQPIFWNSFSLILFNISILSSSALCNIMCIYILETCTTVYERQVKVKYIDINLENWWKYPEIKSIGESKMTITMWNVQLYAINWYQTKASTCVQLLDMSLGINKP